MSMPPYRSSLSSSAREDEEGRINARRKPAQCERDVLVNSLIPTQTTGRCHSLCSSPPKRSLRSPSRLKPTPTVMSTS